MSKFDGPILITGAGGYVGRNLVRHFLASGNRVRGLARSEASAATVASLGAEVARGDMLEPAAIAEALQGMSAVIHAAADTGHGRFDPAQEKANAEGTRLIFGTARALGLSRALHISTEAVLLSGAPLIDANETIAYPARPAGSYSRSKAEAERIALGFATDDFVSVAVRPRFVWGRDDSTALPQLIAAAQSGKLAWIDGGRYLTSTTHIDNLVHGVALALAQGRSGEAYFLSDGEPQPFRGFVSALLAAHGVPVPGRELPRWLASFAARGGDALDRLTRGRLRGPMSWQEYATLGDTVTLDIGKARRELGYVPVITIDDALALERDAAAAKARHSALGLSGVPTREVR